MGYSNNITCAGVPAIWNDWSKGLHSDNNVMFCVNTIGCLIASVYHDVFVYQKKNQKVSIAII